jgi:hypothetical protein
MSNLTSICLITGLAASVLAGSTQAATLLSDGDFTNSLKQSEFTNGTDALNTFYFQESGLSGRQESGGNPGAYLSIGLYESGAVVAIDAPMSISSVAFDYASNTQYDNFQLRIYGLTGDQAVSGSYKINPTATELYVSPGLPTTASVWTAVSFDLSENPAFADLSGFDSIVFKFAGNFDNPELHGIDNLLIEGIAAIPEPSSLALGVFGVLGLFGRRRNG